MKRMGICLGFERCVPNMYLTEQKTLVCLTEGLLGIKHYNEQFSDHI